MKIISISLDKKIFEENSATRQRQIEYGKLCRQMHIIVLGKSGVAPKCSRDSLSEKVMAYEVSGNNFKRFFGAYKLAKEIIIKEKSDLITAQDPFATGLLGWLLKRKFSIPLQLQVHTDFLSPYFRKESIKNRNFVLLAKFLIPKADGLRVVSERIKKSVVSCFRFHISRIFVLPIFVDAEKIKNAPVNADLRKKYPQFDFIILMALRFSREKNIGLAIDAMAEICDANYTNKHTNDANVLKLLNQEIELRLIKQLIRFPEIIEDIAKDYQAHRLPHYTLDLVKAFHKFYEECRVINEKNPALTEARLALVRATQIVLKNSLDLMGISAPEKM